MTEHVVTDAASITAILTSGDLTPPARSGDGAALRLRAAMARFASVADHGPRRRMVDAAIGAVDVEALAGLTRRVAQLRLDGQGDDALRIARTVPVHALLAALDLVAAGDTAAADQIIADVDAVAAVVGRGAEATDDADAAASRLIALAASTAHDPVAVVSLLYQCLDATAAAIATVLHARALSDACGRPVAAVAAVPRTVRVATATVEIGTHRVECGDVVHLAIGAAGLQFGVGPHGCPGRRAAEAITAAAVAVIEDGHEVDLAGVVVDADQRPTTLPLRRRPGTDGLTG